MVKNKNKPYLIENRTHIWDMFADNGVKNAFAKIECIDSIFR